ncbi:MDR family MFS transporter [Peribacillus frigoritolerans]
MYNLKQTNNKILIIVGLIIGIIFAELDETVVSTALPTIVRDLGGLSMYGWVAGIYMLTMTSFMPITGKLGDLYGRRFIYTICISLFILGSLISGFSTSMFTLLLGRGIQGIGASGLIPLAMAIVGEALTLKERTKIQGIFGAMMLIPQLIGPLIGGYLTQHISWHWIFWINIPVGITAVSFLYVGLREESRRDKQVNIDWTGAFLLVGSLLSLLITPVLHQNEGYAWFSPTIIGLWTLGSVLLISFVVTESKAKEPILPIYLFKNRTFVVLSLIVFTMMISVMGAFSSFPFFAQNVFDLTPIKSGYIILPLMVGSILSSVITAQLVTKVPYRYVFAVSLLMPVIGFYLMTSIGVHTNLILIIIYFIVIGLGFGVVLNNNLIVQESTPKEDSGIALSSIALFQSIGMTIGLSIYGSLLASKITLGISGIGGNLPSRSEGAFRQAAIGGIPEGLAGNAVEQLKSVYVYAFQHLYWVSLLLSLVVLFFCWFLKNEVLTSKGKEVQSPEI